MGQGYGGPLGGGGGYGFRGRPFAHSMTARYPTPMRSFAPGGGMFSAVPVGPSALQPTTAPQLSIAPPPALPTPGTQGPLVPQIPSFTPAPFVPTPSPATPGQGGAQLHTVDQRMTPGRRWREAIGRQRRQDEESRA